MVVQHHRPVLQFDGCVVSALHHSQDELGLPASHLRVEASRVHAQWVEVLSLADVAVHAGGALEGESEDDQSCSEGSAHLCLYYLYNPSHK
jgi:hypothetical protein